MAMKNGPDIARSLVSQKASSKPFAIDSREKGLKTAIENAIQLDDTGVVKELTSLLHGGAGIQSLPLLIKANEAEGVKWILNCDAMSQSTPVPAHWILLCQYFQRHQDKDALGLFMTVAGFLVELNLWNSLNVDCLHDRNSSFKKQIFYPVGEVPPKEVTIETLAGLQAKGIAGYIEYSWADQGFANATLWDAIRFGLWRSSAFGTLIAIENVDVNSPDPQFYSRGTPRTYQFLSECSNDPSMEGQRLTPTLLPEQPLGLDLPISMQPLHRTQSPRNNRTKGGWL